jgi:rhodanese-related sulfurtransferase
MQDTATPPEISADTPMETIERLLPGARRALFSRYHIGGCQSCGFAPEETLASVCQRNEDIPVTEAIDHLLASHENDQKMQITPLDLKENLARTKLIDLRTREEHEAVTIPGAELFSEDLQQTAFSTWDKETHIVLYDHLGPRALDVTAYFIGHGFKNAKALAGGIDAYSQQADKSLPRYKVEFEQ